MNTIAIMKRLLILLGVALFTQSALLAQPTNNRPGPQRGQAQERPQIANPEHARAMMMIRLAQMDDEQLERLEKAIGEMRQMSPRQREAFAERTRARLAEERRDGDRPARVDEERRDTTPARPIMSDEERQQMRERVRDMTPEERAELRRDMRQRAEERRPDTPRGSGRE